MDLDVEYNNRARVPEHPEIMEGWQRDAATFRKAARAELDVPYGPSERMKLDLFLPDNDAPQAAAMFIHGGYWQSLDKSYASHLARGLTQHGFAVCVPGYDLCPHVSMTDIVDEIAHACIWTVRLLQMPLVITGHSAGGHLAACMLARDWSAQTRDLGIEPVSAAYAISGLFDLPPLLHTGVNKALGMDAAEAEKLSPMHWPAPQRKRLIAAVGSDESSEYHRQSRELCDTWAKGGALTKMSMVEGANHFTILAPLADPDSDLVRDIVSLAV